MEKKHLQLKEENEDLQERNTNKGKTIKHSIKFYLKFDQIFKQMYQTSN